MQVEHNPATGGYELLYEATIDDFLPGHQSRLIRQSIHANGEIAGSPQRLPFSSRPDIAGCGRELYDMEYDPIGSRFLVRFDYPSGCADGKAQLMIGVMSTGGAWASEAQLDQTQTTSYVNGGLDVLDDGTIVTTSKYVVNNTTASNFAKTRLLRLNPNLSQMWAADVHDDEKALGEAVAEVVFNPADDGIWVSNYGGTWLDRFDLSGKQLARSTWSSTSPGSPPLSRR